MTDTITLPRQTVQQALEALEDWWGSFPDFRSLHDKVAIAALRTALEQQQAEPSQWRDMVVVNLVREGVNKHKARELADHFAASLQQQAEPVAWQVMVEDEAMKEFPIKDMAYDWCIQQKLSGSSYVYWIRPLYTASPQRKPLTDEQADQIISGLQTCHHQSSKREFLKVWLRDWAAHGIKEGI